jgi:hypothetical protein
MLSSNSQGRKWRFHAVRRQPTILSFDAPLFQTLRRDQNGILISSSQNIRIQNITLRRVRNFAILINASSNVQLERVTVEDSGSLGPNGKNNTTGGILFEEGVRDFQVANSSFRDILGNAVWTHSYSASPRNSNGIIHRNEFLNIARDAEHHGAPVALDTAGKVDKSIYRENTFTNIGGQCINLDGFHSRQ